MAMPPEKEREGGRGFALAGSVSISAAGSALVIVWKVQKQSKPSDGANDLESMIKVICYLRLFNYFTTLV